MKQKILFAVVMGAITTALVSFTLIGVNAGFSNGFVALWLRSWLISYLVAVPSIILIAPRVQSLLTRLVSR